MITFNQFNHLTFGELHKVQAYLCSICLILNPERKSIETLLELGLELEANLEFLALEAFLEKCERDEECQPLEPEV